MSEFDIRQGDNLLLLRAMADASVDSVVTDPPYGLSREPDMAEVLKHWLAGDDYTHGGGGFNVARIRKNNHPTVKPIAVGRWLQRLITPRGGVTLDLYAGSGSFGASALLEGFRPILLELDRDAEGKPLGYIDLIRGKCEWALLERAREAEVRAVADREADFRAKQIALFGAAA